MLLQSLLALVLLLRPAPVTVVQWSDIHYGNEEYRPAAWAQARREAAAVHPQMVVISGDQADNKCSQSTFMAREKGVVRDIQAATPKTPVVVCLGNNDVPDNYQSAPDDLQPTIALYRKTIAPQLDDLGNGVYPRDVAGMRWIAINSVIFSPKDHYRHRDEQATRTLDFLQRSLDRVPQGVPVVLVMHVPPVRDEIDDRLCWVPADLHRFVDIVRRHRNPVTVLAGHFHRNEMHALDLGDGRMVPILLAGSLSHKYGAEPNWRTYRFPVQYTIRYPDHPDWQQTWSVPLTPGTFRAWCDRLQSDTAFYTRYMADLFAHLDLWETLSQPPEVRARVTEELIQQSP